MTDQAWENRRRTPAVLRWLATAEAIVGAILLVTIFGLILLQAVQRYLPVDGWVWTGELARFSLVWLTFAMAGYLMARDGHVTLKLVDYVAKGLPRRVVVVFADVMVAIVCLNLAYEAFELVSAPSRQVSPALGMPTNFFYAIPLLGLLLTTVRSVAGIFLPQPATAVDDASDFAEPGGEENRG